MQATAMKRFMAAIALLRFAIAGWHDSCVRYEPNAGAIYPRK
jgi:hypothetical protein